MNEGKGAKQAFILRMNSHENELKEGLENSHISIGWLIPQILSDSTNELTQREFRNFIHDEHYPEEENFRASGAAAGHVWRFLREFHEGDLVVVPCENKFYVAKVLPDPVSSIEEKGLYKRPVEWLNARKAIPRKNANNLLRQRMGIYGTTASATDLLQEIRHCVDNSSQGVELSLKKDLMDRVLREITKGRIDSYGFEKLVCGLMEKLGGIAAIVPRREDKGADIIATYNIAGSSFQKNVAIQVKQWESASLIGEDVVDQLIRGIEAENADLGMVVTTGKFSPEAEKKRDSYFDDKGIKIVFVDGEKLAEMLLDYGFPDRN